MRHCLEQLESRQLLASSVGGLPVNIIGQTPGLMASANPVSTGLTVDSVNEANPLSQANLDTKINLEITLGSGGGVKETSLLRAQLALYENATYVDSTTPRVETNRVITSGGGDTLTIKAIENLKPNTVYRVILNGRNDLPKITDIAGNPFATATYFFTTGTFFNQGDPDIKFSNQTVVTKTTNGAFSAITIGPDNRLYAATLEGFIYRYDINPSTGTLSNEQIYSIVRTNNGGARFITGIVVDPRSTDVNNPVLWVSHGQAKFGDTAQQYADNHTGKISRLYGNNLSTYEDVIINIPRSVKDHLNNQIVFDPIKRNLYFLIPSHSAMGRADTTWGNRAEEISTAALFRLQLQTRGSRVGIEDWLASAGPINLDPASSRPYNFFKGNNPLRFYATGIRNAYDMVWHSNGKLYMPINSSAAGGNTPDDPATPVSESVTGVEQSIDDYLLDIVEAGYYGQPNPARGQYILNGGNPTAGVGNDPAEIRDYPPGTLPDPTYRGIAYNFGAHESPNGVIEYKSDAFGGVLKGQLVVARYAGGADLVFLKPNSDGTFDQDTAATIGTTGVKNMPSVLDVIEDTRNGNLYTITLDDAFANNGTIRLHRPLAGQASQSATKISMYAVPGDPAGASNSVVITNTDPTYTLNIDVSATRFTGLDRRSFVVTDFPTSDVRLRPGESRTFTVRYVARAGETQTRFGNLAIATDDPDGRYSTVVQLRGFLQTPPLSFVRSPATTPLEPSSVGKSVFGVDLIDERELGSLLV